jgi:hypothetical protein
MASMLLLFLQLAAAVAVPSYRHPWFYVAVLCLRLHIYSWATCTPKPAAGGLLVRPGLLLWMRL